mmetsp:Transcript_8952/g.19344  ORF Transcript_8952/g.19344 Transcript_8952/m.19344 type:complete len:100 (-) Transcript_8952:23-322(-)
MEILQKDESVLSVDTRTSTAEASEYSKAPNHMMGIAVYDSNDTTFRKFSVGKYMLSVRHIAHIAFVLVSFRFPCVNVVDMIFVLTLDLIVYTYQIVLLC